MTFLITDKLQTINGREYPLLAVNNLTRVEINNKLHYLNDQIDKLRVLQDMLVDMRCALDDHQDEVDLYTEMFEEV